MKIFILFFLPLALFAKSSFITADEYAAQLYKNPRGIGCQHCHGESGQGKLIAEYVHKKKKKSFQGPSIDSVTYRAFYVALNERKKGMPRYFLTDKEIEALYLHVHKENTQKKAAGVK
jgi:mono/diheme cytochrome c family protein